MQFPHNFASDIDKFSFLMIVPRKRRMIVQDLLPNLAS